jgi:hypothetical protein
MRDEQKAKKNKAAARKLKKLREIEEEKEMNTCDIANDREALDPHTETMKAV